MPDAEAEAAGFVKRPTGTGCLRAEGTDQAGHRTFGFRTGPTESGTSVRAPSPERKSASARDVSGRTGFRPGSCETAGTQGFGRWTCQAEPRLRPRIASAIAPRLRRRCGDDGNGGRESPICQAANRQGFGPDGEPAGNPEGARSPEGLREAAVWTPGSGMVSKPPSRTASPPRLGAHLRRDSGGRRQRRPPLLSGALSSDPVSARHRNRPA